MHSKRGCASGTIGRRRSDGAVEREVAFPRCDETELGQPADFRRKRASLDAEVVRELLAVEWNVEFGCAFLRCHGAQIGHQPILRRS